MKKTLFLLLLLITNSAYTQSYTAFKGENGKYGYKDETEKIVIKPQYDYASDFTVGLGAVELNKKYGFVDKKGNEVIPLTYDFTMGFNKDTNLARVWINDKQGFIDTTGKIVVPLKYDNIPLSFSEGFAAVKLNNKWGFIDLNGKEITPIKYDDAENFYNGLAMVKLNYKQTYIDQSGKEILPFKYTYVGIFNEGLATAELDNKVGFINIDGTEVIPLKFDRAHCFINGKAEVKLDGKEFFIDKTGNDISNPVTNQTNVSQNSYGTLDYRKNNNTLGTGNEKTYLFQSKCKSGNGKIFNVISQVTADIAKHDFDAIKSAAMKTISNNGWQLTTELRYLGLEQDVALTGKAGSDYVLSSASIY